MDSSSTDESAKATITPTEKVSPKENETKTSDDPGPVADSRKLKRKRSVKDAQPEEKEKKTPTKKDNVKDAQTDKDSSVKQKKAKRKK